MNEPWEDEPDQALWRDPNTGFMCHIWRHRLGNHLCGYVVFDKAPTLPEGFIESARVHGGITFYDYIQGNDEDQAEGIDGKYLIGFDCAHAGDRAWGGPGTYRTFEYVKAQTESLATQLQEAMQ